MVYLFLLFFDIMNCENGSLFTMENQNNWVGYSTYEEKQENTSDQPNHFCSSCHNGRDPSVSALSSGNVRKRLYGGNGFPLRG